MALVPKPPPKLVSDLARGSTVAFLGDSITNDTNAGWMGPREYHQWAMALSGGKIQWAGKFGQAGMGFLTAGSSGMTFAQALAGVLALSPRPAKCCILLGGNDWTGSYTIAQTIAAAKSAYAALRAVGIEPVLLTNTPRNDMASTPTTNLKVHTWNQWLCRYGRLNGFQVVDLYSGMVDSTTGGWVSGDNRDTIHPNQTGAKKIGQLVATALTSSRTWTPYLTCDPNDLSGVANSLMTTDATVDGASFQTAADGIPDGWGCASKVAGSSFALTSGGADAKGNWLHVTRSGATAGMTIRLANQLAAVPGDVIAMGFRCKLISAAGKMQTQVIFSSYNSASYGAVSIGTLWAPVNTFLGQEIDIDPATYWFEAPVTATGTINVRCDLFTSVADGELFIGQFTLRNLTALGVA